MGLPSGTPSRSAGLARVATTINKLREGKLGVKWADRAVCFNDSRPVVRTQVRQLTDRSTHRAEFVPQPTAAGPSIPRVKNAFDAGNIPLAPAQHQPAAVQEVRRLRRPVVALDADVVDVGAALGDRAPGRALAVRQAAGHEQVGDAVGAARPQFGDLVVAASRSAAASVGSSSATSSPARTAPGWRVRPPRTAPPRAPVW